MDALRFECQFKKIELQLTKHLDTLNKFILDYHFVTSDVCSTKRVRNF